MKLQLSINLTGAIRKDDAADIHVSFCPALKLYSQGNNEQEAVDALKSAVQLFLLECFRRQQLDRALRECGFTQASATALLSTKG